MTTANRETQRPAAVTRRALCLLIALCVAFLLFGCAAKGTDTSASTRPAVTTTTPDQKLPAEMTTTEAVTTTPSDETQGILDKCTATICFSLDDRTILFAKELHKPIQVASITKLVTACTALQYISPEEVLTVSSELSLVQKNSSLCQIAKGQKLTMADLLTGLLVKSGNDAAYTVAVNAARAAAPQEELSDTAAVKAFCGRMNAFAESIGMTESHFVNPEGWDSDAQHTTVSDMAILANYAMRVPSIRKIIRIQKKDVQFASGQTITWENTNQLLKPDSKYYSAAACGMKTGTTDAAGNCLASVFSVGGQSWFILVVGCKSDDDRYVVTRRLYETYCAPAEPETEPSVEPATAAS
ncbi:MAG: D-alanyl-D-alanine carboxypeptidase [Clostridia bacterium]|nr:D-alanyl-D-alanine carboxypeptidase [Clostridia bacterium]